MKKKILFIIYDLEPAGPELRLLDLARRMPSTLAMHICVLSSRQTLKPQFEELGIPVMSMPLPRGYLGFSQILHLRRYIRNHGIGLLSLYDGKGMLVAACARLFLNPMPPAFFNAVSLGHDFVFRQRLLFRLLFLTMGKIVCNSKKVGDRLKEFQAPRKKITLIYNGVDSHVFDPKGYDKKEVRAKLGFQKNDLVMGTLANIRPVKNYPFLIQGFKKLSQSRPHLRLLCVGGGDGLNNIRDMAERLNLGDKVKFTGLTDQPASFLSAMDFFVMCSKHEGFPNALLQALAMGLPSISSHVGGCGEMVAHGENGFLYPSGDMNAFHGFAANLADDPGLRQTMSLAARKTAVERFSMEQMVRRYTEFFITLSL